MGALDWIKRPHGLECVDSRLPRPVVLNQQHQVITVRDCSPEESRHTEIWPVEPKAAGGPMKAKGPVLRRPAALA